MEVFKNIEGYEGYYQISNIGNVKSFHEYRGTNERMMSLCNHKHGYHYVLLVINNTRKKFLVHRLVAEAFIPNSDNKPCVNHINGIKTDNRVENLEWCTHSENELHAYRTGLQKPPNVAGVNNPMFGKKQSEETKLKQSLIKKGKHGMSSKLKEEDVIDIRKRYREGMKQNKIAELYNVQPPAINKILIGKTWSWL